MNEEELIFQGAEGKLYKTDFLGLSCVVKERFKKRYRHPQLDDTITKSRIVAEARAMVRSRKAGVDCPVIYFIDSLERKMYMERIHGISLKQFLDLCDHRLIHRESRKDNNNNKKNYIIRPSDNITEDDIHILFNCTKEWLLEQLPREVGQTIARLHDTGLIHGDITTSNLMIRSFNSTCSPTTLSSAKSFSITLLDFGLCFNSSMAEDKAVDLYVMERALNSSHSHLPSFMESLLKFGYFPYVKKSDSIAQKLEEVRQRGRKRLMVG